MNLKWTIQIENIYSAFITIIVVCTPKATLHVSSHLGCIFLLKQVTCDVSFCVI